MARRHKRRKRGGSSPFLSFITFCIVVGAIITSVIVFLKVADIEVSGTTRYSGADIIETSGIKTGDNMFLVNKFDVAEKILDEYPYIEQIKIRRRLPDTFTFEITERVPTAYVVESGNRWIVDKKGYLLEMAEADAEIKLPKVTGCEVVTPSVGSPLILKNDAQSPVLLEVLSALTRSALYEKVNRIEIGKLYSINLVYDNRFLVILGDSAELSRKIEMLGAVIAELSEFDKGTIDISAIYEARFRPNSEIDLSEKPLEAEKPENSEENEEAPEEDSGAEAEETPDLQE